MRRSASWVATDFCGGFAFCGARFAGALRAVFRFAVFRFAGALRAVFRFAVFRFAAFFVFFFFAAMTFVFR